MMKKAFKLSAVILALILTVISVSCSYIPDGGDVCDTTLNFDTNPPEITEDAPDTSALPPDTQQPPDTTETPETKAPETKAPETKAPETKAPETKALETKAPETKAPETTKARETTQTAVEKIKKNGTYTTKEDVALYIHTYGKLPKNFITKQQAGELGWNGGGLDKYAKGKCIGGDYFGNFDGDLPKKKGRKYMECDIDTLGSKSRGAKRIIYSNDGLIYYTDDHYETFELLYGNP